MFLTGHIASALLASRRWALDPRIVIAATLFPDVVDKSAKHLLHVVPFGRLPAHTLLVLALTAGIVFLVDRHYGRHGRWLAAWLAGYVAHLVLDFSDIVPLLWPFRPYGMPEHPLGSMGQHTAAIRASMIIELILVVAAVIVEIRRRRRLALPSVSTEPRY